MLALPRGSDYGASKAWEIVKPTIGEVPGQERLFLTFPMSKDPERLRPAWERTFARIGAELGLDLRDTWGGYTRQRRHFPQRQLPRRRSRYTASLKGKPLDRSRTRSFDNPYAFPTTRLPLLVKRKLADAAVG